jgi:hypothetical protein
MVPGQSRHKFVHKTISVGESWLWWCTCYFSYGAGVGRSINRRITVQASLSKKWDPISKITRARRAWKCGTSVVHLLCKCLALSPNPSPPQKINVNIIICVWTWAFGHEAGLEILQLLKISEKLPLEWAGIVEQLQASEEFWKCSSNQSPWPQKKKVASYG